MKTFNDILIEVNMKSTGYALTGSDNVIIVKGSKKDMHRLRKQKGTGFTVWNSPGGKVGDKLK
jgi:nitrous oxidase accessory protein NosD